MKNQSEYDSSDARASAVKCHGQTSDRLVGPSAGSDCTKDPSGGCESCSNALLIFGPREGVDPLFWHRPLREKNHVVCLLTRPDFKVSTSLRTTKDSFCCLCLCSQAPLSNIHRLVGPGAGSACRRRDSRQWLVWRDTLSEAVSNMKLKALSSLFRRSGSRSQRHCISWLFPCTDRGAK